MSVDGSSDEMEVSSKGSNDSGDSASGNPSTLGNQACPPHRQGAPESQALLTDTSAGPSSRASIPTSASENTERGGEMPPNEEHVGEQHPDAERSNTLDRRVSKYVSNAQKILLSVFEEIMEFYDSKGLCELFLKALGSARRNDDIDLLFNRLVFYCDQMGTSILVKYSCMSPDRTLEEAMENGFHRLLVMVITAITYTWSADTSREYKNIMEEYEKLQSFYRKYLAFCRKVDIRREDEDSRNNAECLKKITDRLLLQTRNAFRELLIHVGENAENVSDYEEGVLGEDLNCLTRHIVDFGGDVAEEADSRDDVAEGADSREGSSGGN